jgi:hypothetical protein
VKYSVSSITDDEDETEKNNSTSMWHVWVGHSSCTKLALRKPFYLPRTRRRKNPSGFQLKTSPPYYHAGKTTPIGAGGRYPPAPMHPYNCWL